MVKKNRVRVLVLCAVMIALLAGSGRAGWFGWGDDGSTKRLHRELSDKAAGQELSQLLGMKQILTKERQVLLVLTEEKKQELVDVDAEITRSFGLRPDRNYRYDEKARTIFEEAGKERHVVKKLGSLSESIKFASLAGAKQRVQDDLMVLTRMAKEKEQAVSRINGVLQTKFAMSRDRNYWYDAKTMKIYEVIPPAPRKP
jgi:hypothetical protein